MTAHDTARSGPSWKLAVEWLAELNKGQREKKAHGPLWGSKTVFMRHANFFSGMQIFFSLPFPSWYPEECLYLLNSSPKPLQSCAFVSLTWRALTPLFSSLQGGWERSEGGGSRWRRQPSRKHLKEANWRFGEHFPCARSITHIIWFYHHNNTALQAFLFPP